MDRLTASWLSDPSLQNLFEIFEKKEATLLLVGGSVRDGLLALPVEDIDLAVNRDPQWVLQCLNQNHIQAIPTGIEHGTITAVINKRPYQITTLRVDVKTFGRKAEVAFTEDWVQDAQRRDFTINAIYANRAGELFDPVGGLKDLKTHTVRFIGDAAQRIQEDYLRILRFFRFSARFGHEPYDPDGLEACTRSSSFLSQLARERVTEEFLKILGLSDPTYALQMMEKTATLPHILPHFSQKALSTLIDLEKHTACRPCSLLRLAALQPIFSEVQTHLRLSQKQQNTLSFFLQDHPVLTETSLKQQTYLFGKTNISPLAYLQTAQRVTDSKVSLQEGVTFLKYLCQFFATWDPPAFPLPGHDIIKTGVKEGSSVGALLRQVEEWWLSEDLEPDRQACLSYLASLL